MSSLTQRVVALAVALTLAGCGGGSSNLIVRTGPVHSSVGPDGKLDADPGPLTVSDLDALPRHSPQAAVMRLLFWGQWGGLPQVTNLYARSTVDALGPRSIRRTYEIIRAALLLSRPEVAFTCRNGRSAFVAVDLLSRTSSPDPESFLLHRRGTQWRVVFDTNLGERDKGFPERRAANTAAEIAGTGALRGGRATVSPVGNGPDESCRSFNRHIRALGS